MTPTSKQPHACQENNCKRTSKHYHTLSGLVFDDQPTQSNELRKKVRRVFNYRTHRTDEKITVITKDPEVRKYKTIIAPYEPTVEKIVELIQTNNTHLLERLRNKAVPHPTTPAGKAEFVPLSVVDELVKELS